ncbi:acyltransferase family protein [Pseudarthrobacter sp. J64]|uniref:acyltransferase family protein n=1 Tax=Pseudarthrobacter sp. J64 TaxID=3116485 RepID=UPI002E8061DC|nr:acyltransferase family protein [Pseudarthrobacter sp. J64]MEE2567948.1 acyltransferase family protein [Pseudarthrobacter sp. J64]
MHLVGAAEISRTGAVRDTARDTLVDGLRGFAIAAMLVAHGAPLLGKLPSVPGAAFDALNDVASPLFALVMGMAGLIVLKRGDTAVSFVSVKAVQGLLLIVAGLLLMSLHTWVGVVLPQLGLVLILGAPLLLLPARWLGWAAGLAFLAGPVIVMITGLLVPATWVTQPESGPQLLQWLVTGRQYRLTSLLPFFLLGAFLYSTRALYHLRQSRALLWSGLALTVAWYPAASFARASGAGFLVTSGGYLDLVRDLGLVALVTGVAGLAAGARRKQVQRLARLPITILAGPGKLALSLYAAHVLVLLPISYAMVAQSPAVRALTFVAFVVGLLLAGWLWARFLGKGPLEALMTWVGGLVRKLTGKTVAHAA